jgi:hypothetical protein
MSYENQRLPSHSSPVDTQTTPSYQPTYQPPPTYNPIVTPPSHLPQVTSSTQPHSVASNPYVPQQQQQQPTAAPSRPTGAPIKKDAAYFKAIGEAKKKTQNAISELDFSNVSNAIKFLKEALVQLQPYE